VTSPARHLEIGDLAVTHDMGTASGLIALIVGKGSYDNPDWACFDILIRGEIFDGVDEEFLLPVGCRPSER
jgi:hypothetical protein